MPSTRMSDLDSRFRPIAQKLIDGLAEVGVPVKIVCTLRSLEEQKQAVAHGNSWTLNSKHLPQQPEGKSWAIDLVPVALINTKNWSPQHPDWWVLARAAVNLGLRSGMDWHDQGLPPQGHARSSWDPGHCEWRGPDGEQHI